MVSLEKYVAALQKQILKLREGEKKKNYTLISGMPVCLPQESVGEMQLSSMTRGVRARLVAVCFAC